MTPLPRPAWLGASAAGLVLAAVAGLLAWPAPIAPASWAVGGGGGDFNGIAWGMWRVAEAWPGLPDPHVDLIVHPDGASLLVADLAGAWLLAPLTMLAGAVVATNALQLAHVGLAGAATWLLVRDRGASPSGAGIAATAFALSNVLLTGLHNGNPDVTPLFVVPLAGFLVGRAAGSWAWALAAALGIGLAPWFNPYCAVMAGLCAICCLPWSRRPGAWLRVLLAGAGALALGGLWVAMVTGTLTAGDSMVLKTAARPIESGIAWPDGFFWPGLTREPDPWTTHGWYLGLSVVILGAWGLATRPAGWLRWLLLGGAGLVLSLGRALHWGGQAVDLGGSYLWLPGAWLATIPGFDQLQIVYRFSALLVLALAVLAARAPLPPRLAWAGALVVALDLLGPGRGAWLVQSGPVATDEACALLDGLPEGAVVDLPPTHEEQWMLAQTCHGRPIAQGINKPFPQKVRRALDHSGSRPFWELHDLGYRYLVFHHALGDRPDQARMMADLEATARSLELLAVEGEDVVVFDLSLADKP